MELSLRERLRGHPIGGLCPWLLAKHKASQYRRIRASDMAWDSTGMNARPSARIQARLMLRPLASVSSSVLARRSRPLSASLVASPPASLALRLSRSDECGRSRPVLSSGYLPAPLHLLIPRTIIFIRPISSAGLGAMNRNHSDWLASIMISCQPHGSSSCTPLVP